MGEEERTLEEILTDACHEAYKRFIKHIEDEGYDPAYFKLELQGARVSGSDFKTKLFEVILKF